MFFFSPNALATRRQSANVNEFRFGSSSSPSAKTAITPPGTVPARVLGLATVAILIALPLGIPRPMPLDGATDGARRVWTMGWPFWAPPLIA